MVMTEVTIARMALSHLGHTTQFDEGDGTVFSLDNEDESIKVAVEALQLWYDSVRDEFGRAFTFGRALKYDVLVLAEADPASQVWAEQWENAWTYPDDALYFRGFVIAAGVMPTSAFGAASSGWMPAPGISWAIGTHNGTLWVHSSSVVT